MNSKNTTIDYGKGCVLQVAPDRDSVTIILSKELVKKTKIVFEDTGIPGVIGPNLYVDAQNVADRYMADYQCRSCVYNDKGLCYKLWGLVFSSERVGRCSCWRSCEKEEND